MFYGTGIGKEQTSPNMQALVKSLLVSHSLTSHWVTARSCGQLRQGMGGCTQHYMTQGIDTNRVDELRPFLTSTTPDYSKIVVSEW